MSVWLREDTAVTIVIGPFVDPTTPATEEEALTVNQAAVRLSKNGGAFAQKNDATTASHMENGFYSCPLNATDTSTPGSLVVAVDDANALIWWKEYHVVPQQVWDSLFSTDRLQVHAAEISNDLITAAAIANGAIDAATFAAGAITATVIATDAIDADAIADNAINAASIASDAITAAKIADGAIDAATFAAGAINAAAIASDAITAAKIATDAIAEIADGVWDEDIDAAHQTANTAGKRLDDASSTVATNLNATVSSRSAFNAASDTVNLSTTSEGQIDAIETRVTTALPNSAPGAAGGLPLYDDLFSVVAEGTLDTVTSAGEMTLSSGFASSNDFYNGMFLVPQDGPAAFQPRAISDYVGSTKTCTFTGTGSQLSRPFSVAPEAGDSIKILGLSGTV